MGKGWLHEYELFLLCEEDGGILAILPDTHLERFVKQDGQWVKRRGSTKEYTLTEHSDYFELLSCRKKPTGTTPLTENQYSYNSLGQLTEASGGGVVYNYTYTPNGNVMDKLVNGSKALSYAYTAGGKVAGITDKSGKATTYAYD